MILVLDVGNTNMVFGVYKDDELIVNWRISTYKEKTSDEYSLVFKQIFEFNKHPGSPLPLRPAPAPFP